MKKKEKELLQSLSPSLTSKLRPVEDVKVNSSLPLTSEPTKGRATVDDEGVSPLLSHGLKINEPLPLIPSKFHYFKRKQLRQELINKKLAEYNQPILLADGSHYTPDLLDVGKYRLELLKLSLEDLNELNGLQKYEYRLQARDRLRSLNKKKYAAVTIVNDNKSLDTFTVPVHSRIFSHDSKTYLVKSEAGFKDVDVKMIHFFYFSNNPFPYEFKNASLGNNPDSSLLDNTIEFKVIEALANLDMSKMITIVLVATVLIFILAVVTLLVCLKGFKMI